MYLIELDASYLQIKPNGDQLNLQVHVQGNEHFQLEMRSTLVWRNGILSKE